MPATAPIKELRLTRQIAAPPTLIWKAWTDPEAYMQWMGPVDWDIADCDFDLRPGGKWRATQRDPDGALHPTGGHYLVVDPPRHLGFVWLMTAPDGTVLLEAEHHIRLVASGNGTALSLDVRILVAGPGSEGFVNGVEMGWSGALGKLAHFVEG